MNQPNILIGPFDFFGKFVKDLDLPNVKTFALGSMSQELTHIKALSEISSVTADLVYDIKQDQFSSILERLPPDWVPDFIVYWEPIYQAVLPGIENCPIPVVLIPADFYVSGVFTEYYLPLFDHILIDEGLKAFLPPQTPTTYWPSFYYDASLFVHQNRDERPIDICFIGNMNHDIHKERGFLLEKIAPLSKKYQVYFGSGVFGKDYVNLLNQSKIVVNFSVRGEMNLRGFEAPACGALLFMEESNLEVEHFFQDRESCVLYNSDNILELLEYYLQHTEKRQEIARKGHAISQYYSYQKTIPQMLETLGLQYSEHQLQKKEIQSSKTHLLWAQAHQLVNTHTPGAYKRGLELLSSFLKENPHNPEMSHLYATSLYYENCPDTYLKASFELIKSLVHQYPEHLILHFNCGFLALKNGEYEQAHKHFERVLNIHTYPALFLPIIEGFGFFKIQWERAYFTYLEKNDPQPLIHLIHGQALKLLSEIALQSGAPQSATGYLTKALEILPHWGDSALTLAQIYFNEAKFQAVIKVCEKAILTSPLSFDVWSLLAKSYFLTCNWSALIAFATSKLQVIDAFHHEGQICKIELQNLLQMAHFAQQYKSKGAVSPKEQQALILSVSSNEFRFYLQHMFNVLQLTYPHLLSAHLIYEWTLKGGEPPPLSYPGNSPHQVSVSVTQANRSYQALFSPELFPYQFPESDLKPRQTNAPKNRTVLLLNNWELPHKTLLESIFVAVSGQKNELWIWSPEEEPNEDFLSDLEEAIPDELEKKTTLLAGRQSLSEWCTIFEQTFCLIGEPSGEIDWYLWWALKLSIPVVFTRPPHALFGTQTAWFKSLETCCIQDVLEQQAADKIANQIELESKKTLLKQFQYVWKHLCKSHFSVRSQ